MQRPVPGDKRKPLTKQIPVILFSASQNLEKITTIAMRMRLLQNRSPDDFVQLINEMTITSPTIAPMS